MSERLGVTVGKFYPPHRGHSHLIQVAKGRCDRLVVLVCDHPTQTIRATERAAWLADLHPDVEFVCTPDDLPDAPQPWAQRTIEVLGRRPDVAFTSEEYGDGWADAMGCPHEAVDISRTAVGISATRIRGAFDDEFRWMVPQARRALALDVVVAGSESTGTTTLSQALARDLETAYVPEYGRDYWVQREADKPGEPWTTDDFLHIADTHHGLGDSIALGSSGVTVWDTDAMCTAVWHRRYLGFDAPEMEERAASFVPDLYILTVPDFPFVQDGTREDGPHRIEMHEQFKERIIASGAPWIEVSGPHEERMAAAHAAITAEVARRDARLNLAAFVPNP